nr:MAG TPA: hypothetical protein [Caudoviricetes sp.]
MLRIMPMILQRRVSSQLHRRTAIGAVHILLLGYRPEQQADDSDGSDSDGSETHITNVQHSSSSFQYRAYNSGAFAPEKHNVKYRTLGECNESHQTYARGELRTSRSSYGSDVRLYTVALSPPCDCLTRSDWQFPLRSNYS